MGTRQFHKTKKVFKLPADIPKDAIKNIFSTSKNISVEGYTGKIITVSSIKGVGNLLACRKVGNHGARAWVKIS